MNPDKYQELYNRLHPDTPREQAVKNVIRFFKLMNDIFTDVSKLSIFFLVKISDSLLNLHFPTYYYYVILTLWFCSIVYTKMYGRHKL